MGNNIATHWVNNSRYVEAWEICREILQLGEDYRILGTIARAEEVLGFVQEALKHFQQALQLCPEEDLKEKAATLHNMARLKSQQGDIAGASVLFQQSLDIHESINNFRDKAATLQEIAHLKIQQGDISGAIALFQQSLDIYESINDVAGKAATLANMAGLKAQQGDIAGAIALFQQSLDINESINDVRGKAMTLMNMAYWEGERGNKTQELQLYLQAAQLLGQVRAYINLCTTLGLLSLTDETKGIIYLAQAVWLCLRIEVPLTDTVDTLHVMYNRVAQGDEMEALLGAVAVYFYQIRGASHPQLEDLEQHSFQILLGAAAAQGIEKEEAFDTWIVQQRLNEPEYFIPQLKQRLEAIIGDEWLFERF
ncbi:tetratricopeptide repeat protein [Anabaena sp. CCY 0017]|uniref:tetratricopeptide repeat protein n=1 Tax=Anabaena sp. CCY 0017 TaxID=3103866 RepID=UPI0039C5F3B4